MRQEDVKVGDRVLASFAGKRRKVEVIEVNDRGLSRGQRYGVTRYTVRDLVTGVYFTKTAKALHQHQ